VTTQTKTGRYQIVDELGRGAMGVVHRAHDPVIGRDVAVKTMHMSPDGESVSRPDFVSRFQTEARAAGLLTHPNIVVVYDAGEENGLFYIAMELVEGRSLQSMIDAKQSFPLPRVLRIMEQACAALDYAHQHNVVHRDIKPANLMLTPDGTLKITDFGTAKILQFNTTQTAHVIGTPSYMSPEQIKGKTVDGRSDIFSLGVILYELVTGEKPFPGQNITTVIYKIVNEEPIPPRQLDPSLHPGICAVISRALAKEPTDRYKTCGEMLEALSNYRSAQEPQESSRPGTPLPSSSRQSLKPGTRYMTSRPPSRIKEAALPKLDTSLVGHAAQTVYQSSAPVEKTEKPKKKSGVGVALLLLAVIGATAYYVRPYYKDVWGAFRTEVLHQQDSAVPSATEPSTDEPGTSSSASVPIVKPKAKAATASSAATTTQPDTGADATPPEKVKSVGAASTAKVPGASGAPNAPLTSPFDKTVPVAPSQPLKSAPQPPATSQAPSTVAPAAAGSPTSDPRVAQLESLIEHRLANAGMGGRVKVSIAGNGILLQGRLKPAEHQALMNNLSTLPDWAQITDDVAYDDAQPDTTATASDTTFGFVSVTSTPAGAEIRIDGLATGKKTPAQIRVPSGVHTIAVWYAGNRVARQVVNVQANQTTKVDANSLPE
jgi:eukaryotic-like serine/threonine-protein kinase